MLESTRFDSVTRAPLHTMIELTVNGVTTLRAYDKMGHMRQRFFRDLDMNANVMFCWAMIFRWIGIRLDLITAIFISVTAFCCTLFKGRIDENYLIILLQIVVELMTIFSVTIRLAAEFENYMTSSQRMVAYTKIESEDLLKKPKDREMAAAKWPQEGRIEFKGVQMRYRVDLEPSIKDLSFVAPAGMKVGIVGRTGSGKSSIL